MLKKMTIAGAIVAVAGLGLGGAAWAQSAKAPAAASVHTELTASTTAPTTGTAMHGAHKHKKSAGKDGALVKRLEKVSHAQWVSKDKAGIFVTHDAVRGSVSAVSGNSITVKATDGTPETFVVNAGTKIHVKGGVKGTPGKISAVKPGDEVGVLGTGTAPMVATHVADRGTSHAPKSTTPMTTAPTTS